MTKEELKEKNNRTKKKKIGIGLMKEMDLIKKEKISSYITKIKR